MKLLVFADSHSRPAPVLEVIQQERDANAVFFLGDGLRELQQHAAEYVQLPMYAVQGNCDMTSLEAYDGLVPFGGVLIYFTHGHLLGVKQSLDELWWTAQRRGAQVALYGHTHIPSYEVRAGIHLCNPGSVSSPRFGAPSYGILRVQGAVPSFEICKLRGEYH